MRGDHTEPDAMFSYVSPAQRVPKDHPLRAIRTMVDDVLGRLWSDFEKLYSHTGRPSIPPERLLRALLLQVLYSIRRAGVDGAARLQPALPLVCRPVHGRPDLGSDGVHHADKGYDVAGFLDELRQHEVTPHVAKKIRHGAIDGRSTRHSTYEVSQRMRKRVEEIFGWLKTVGMTNSSRDELLQPLLEVHILAMPTPVAIAALDQHKTK